MSPLVKTGLALAALATAVAGAWAGWARPGLQWSLAALSSFCL